VSATGELCLYLVTHSCSCLWVPPWLSLGTWIWEKPFCRRHWISRCPSDFFWKESLWIKFTFWLPWICIMWCWQSLKCPTDSPFSMVPVQTLWLLSNVSNHLNNCKILGLSFMSALFQQYYMFFSLSILIYAVYFPCKYDWKYTECGKTVSLMKCFPWISCAG
jgi:hypothetical protein